MKQLHLITLLESEILSRAFLRLNFDDNFTIEKHQELLKESFEHIRKAIKKHKTETNSMLEYLLDELDLDKQKLFKTIDTIEECYIEEVKNETSKKI